MLSLVYNAQNNAIYIDCDEAGLKVLALALKRLKSNGGHLHLWAPSAGGHDLSDVTPFGEKAISEVIITMGGD